jgi:hypothetical protein
MHKSMFLGWFVHSAHAVMTSWPNDLKIPEIRNFSDLPLSLSRCLTMISRLIVHRIVFSSTTDVVIRKQPTF